MLSRFNKMLGQEPPQKGAPLAPATSTRPPLPKAQPPGRDPTYARIFRWHLPNGQTPVPHAVEIVGSFTDWEKVPLHRDAATGTWQVTIAHILANKTHHYMLLVDGQPAQDRNCDGLAVPVNPVEEQYQLATPRGPRVLMLFAQAK